MHDDNMPPRTLGHCDRCTQPAVSQWRKGNGRPLTFCAHHHRALGPSLRADGWAVTQDDLQARQTSPA